MPDSTDPVKENRQTADEASESELVRILQADKGKRHIIVLQDFPDPDAISSAYAHQLISKQFKIKTDIVYSGRISHQQNIALVRLLKIDLIRYEGSLNLKQYSGAVFVDNQGTTADEIVKGLEATGVPALVVVDHHEAQKRLEPQFKDVRSGVGATATIYTEYLERGLVEMDKTNQDHVTAATALMHGIITDTNGFIRAEPADFHAAAFLSQFKDPELLEQIMSQARSKQTMEITHRALGNRLTVENISVSGIGYLRAENRDAIPQAADFLLTEENVHTAIVYGIVTGEGWEETLVGSMRTSKITIDPDAFIKEVFGKDASGHYFGGGKMSAGGFKIPIGFLSGGDDEQYRKEKWRVYDAQIKQKIFAKIGVDWKDVKQA